MERWIALCHITSFRLWRKGDSSNLNHIRLEIGATTQINKFIVWKTNVDLNATWKDFFFQSFPFPLLRRGNYACFSSETPESSDPKSVILVLHLLAITFSHCFLISGQCWQSSLLPILIHYNLAHVPSPLKLLSPGHLPPPVFCQLEAFQSLS